MVMSFCGESISFDLNTLDDDPEAIVSLLKTTSSDRDKWMLVGASYRRLGKVSAAVAVMTSMIEGQYFLFEVMCYIQANCVQ